MAKVFCKHITIGPLLVKGGQETDEDTTESEHEETSLFLFGHCFSMGNVTCMNFTRLKHSLFVLICEQNMHGSFHCLFEEVKIPFANFHESLFDAHVRVRQIKSEPRTHTHTHTHTSAKFKKSMLMLKFLEPMLFFQFAPLCQQQRRP